jgi:hypothetical protein
LLASLLALQCLLVPFDFVVSYDRHYLRSFLSFGSQNVGRIASIKKLVARVEELPLDLDQINPGTNRSSVLDSVLPVDRFDLLITTD